MSLDVYYANVKTKSPPILNQHGYNRNVEIHIDISMLVII